MTVLEALTDWQLMPTDTQTLHSILEGDHMSMISTLTAEYNGWQSGLKGDCTDAQPCSWWTVRSVCWKVSAV